MARGWESKSVEAQQADREHAEAPRPELSPDEARRLQVRQTLELARRRATHDLTRATVPAHRAMLEAAVRAIDEQLAADDGAAR